MPEAEVAAVLDASVLMAVLHDEDGADAAAEAIANGAAISVANWAEDQGPRLSLADRACLALAERLGVPAVTADQEWAKADVGAEVQLIR